MDTEFSVSGDRNRSLRTLNLSEKILVILGVIGLCFTVAVAIYTLVTENNDKISESEIFAIIVIICCVFTFFYLIRGIYGERSYELMIYVISATSLMFYIIINFINRVQTKQTIQPIYIIRLVVALVIIPFTSVLGAILAYNYNVRGNLMFYTVGGLEELQENCKNLFIFEALMQLDFQFELCIIALSVAEKLEFGLFQIIILSVGIPFAILWRFLGFFSMRLEIQTGSYLFLVLGLLEPAFVIFIIYSTIQNIVIANQTPITLAVTPVVSITFACCLFSLFIHILLLIMAVSVSRNFGHGLKEKINSSFMKVFVRDHWARGNVNRTTNDEDDDGVTNPLLLDNNNTR